MGDQAFAPFAPAPERRHIRLHPGFVNEHKAIRIDRALMALPPFTSAGQLRPVLLCRQHGFFEAFAFAMEKAADIGWMDFEAAVLQSPRQPLKRHMLRPIDHRQDPDAMLAADQRPSMTAHLARLNTAGTALALRPLDHARRRDIQSGGNRMTCLALPHTGHRQFSQIHRISTTHRTSSMAHSTKSDLRQKRNPDSTKSQSALKQLHKLLRTTGKNQYLPGVPAKDSCSTPEVQRKQIPGLAKAEAPRKMRRRRKEH
ncbi:hypothetical protein GGI64_001922 [Rhizobium leguminosarum]|uniref:Uncharacterized protein n=1 Tax=Rhizobium leguminosarum TaxID=384 RepID=A0A7Z0DWV6_RHILE|nr:hypothetical protein [Rhizobium leguminosarum]NYJ10875.1 hypothetical protein [Rhizobium leguminosarum]